MKKQIAHVEIPVPYKSAGNVIIQKTVAFDVYKIDGHYSLHPLLTSDELRLANLPPELNFTIEDGKPVSLRGNKDGNLHVIQDAVEVLQKEQQLL